MDELMTIGRFAERTGLSVSALRFYAAQGLLEPAEIDASSGYRRYANEQVDDGRLVRDLRRLEMPLADIAAALGRPAADRKRIISEHLRRLESIVERAHDVARSLGVTDSEETNMQTTLGSRDLATALDQVLPAASSDLETPDLMTVLIESKDGSVRIVATDRYRLAVRDVVPAERGETFSAVVPAASLERWRTDLDREGTARLESDGTQLRLTGDQFEHIARVMPVTFPDYEPLLVPVAASTRVAVARAQLLTVLSSTEEEGRVWLRVSGAGLVVETDGVPNVVEAAIEGPDQTVLLDIRYLRDAVEGAVGPEVVLEIEQPFSPVVIRSADDGTFTTRLMPIKPD